MLLVDSTIWIDYFNGRATPHTDYLHQVLSQRLILVGDIILAEVLQGFRLDQEFDLARQHLTRFSQVSMLNPMLAVESAIHYRALRKQGITIRKTVNCFIATYCITNDCELLHDDRDFEPFERHLGLGVVHPA